MSNTEPSFVTRTSGENAPLVKLDLRADRLETVVGWALWRRLLKRSTPMALLMAMGTTLGLSERAISDGRVLLGFLVAFVGFCLGIVLFWLIALLGDLWAKRSICERFGLEAQYGLDTVQARRVTISPLPEDLENRLIDAFRSTSVDFQVNRNDGNCWEARLPRRGRDRLQTTMTVRVLRAEAVAKVVIESRLTELWGFTDAGQNIANVEYFQANLKSIIEGRGAPMELP